MFDKWYNEILDKQPCQSTKVAHSRHEDGSE